MSIVGEQMIQRLQVEVESLRAERDAALRERDELGPLFIRDQCRAYGIDENDYLRLDKLGKAAAALRVEKQRLEEALLAVAGSDRSWDVAAYAQAILDGAPDADDRDYALTEHDLSPREQKLQAEVEQLRDRAVCSGCGSDVSESGICPYAGCDDGQMIPSSDLPQALREACDAQGLQWAERVTERDESREREQKLQEALRRITENAEAWHGNPESCVTGHARALTVIAGVARAALAAAAGPPAGETQ